MTIQIHMLFQHLELVQQLVMLQLEQQVLYQVRQEDLLIIQLCLQIQHLLHIL